MKILDINSFCLFQGQDGHITDLDERFGKKFKKVKSGSKWNVCVQEQFSVGWWWGSPSVFPTYGQVDIKLLLQSVSVTPSLYNFFYSETSSRGISRWSPGLDT